MTESHEAVLARQDDGTVTVEHADPVIWVSPELLGELEGWVIDGDVHIQLDTAGEYVYRFVVLPAAIGTWQGYDAPHTTDRAGGAAVSGGGCDSVHHVRAVTVPRPNGVRVRIAIDWAACTLTAHEDGDGQAVMHVRVGCQHAVIPELSRVVAYLSPLAPPVLPAPGCQQPGGACYGSQIAQDGSTAGGR